MSETAGRRGADWRAALRRTPVAVWNDDVSDWAAALTYYTVLALFPALLVAVSVTGLTYPGGAQEFIYHVTAMAPADSRAVLRSALEDMASRPAAAWLLIVLGTLGSLVSSVSYLSIFRRVQHAMHGVEDRHSLMRKLPRTILSALLLLSLLLSSALVVILTGDVMRTLGRALGTDGMAVALWDAAKWPLLLCLAAVLVLILFRTGPAEARAVRHGLLGGVLAVGLWLVASAGFAFYATQVGTYNRLYGPLAGFIVFLVWIWVTNLALLTGAQFNAELTRSAADRQRGEAPEEPEEPEKDRPAPGPEEV
ncbi:YihY/virulence factor BrkB family protein [Streptomyces sp. ACA25]|uniref:YihY/virulence factor BrkB family protein n=1 Tax=Streptomyces sp. ACA25 TaxID=3022596 RepID=UPI0023074F9A|nr:YihY/virulence factor BrkB family protein [Streptomyces sp. ACA25]MDB1087117.1 YihY/virulence factor BrkB family protein [Streptomyces sp. ACA25]